MGATMAAASPRMMVTHMLSILLSCAEYARSQTRLVLTSPGRA